MVCVLSERGKGGTGSYGLAGLETFEARSYCYVEGRHSCIFIYSLRCAFPRGDGYTHPTSDIGRRVYATLLGGRCGQGHIVVHVVEAAD